MEAMNPDRRATYVALARQVFAESKDFDTVVEALQAARLSIVESIIVVKEAFDRSLGEAKVIVDGSPCWHAVAQASAAMVDEYIEHEVATGNLFLVGNKYVGWDIPADELGSIVSGDASPTGEPVVDGTPLTCAAIVLALHDELPLDEFLERHPSVGRGDVFAALVYCGRRDCRRAPSCTYCADCSLAGGTDGRDVWQLASVCLSAPYGWPRPAGRRP